MEEIIGEVENIVYANETNGYTVCEITSGDKEVVAVGYLPFINIGETVKLTGEWVNHQEYGEQFNVKHFEKSLPQTTNSIEKYLSSGIIKGIGKATAKKIVDKFGEYTIEVIRSEPLRLTEVKGIKLSKAMEIGETFTTQWGVWQIVLFVQSYGFSINAATKIYKLYGENAVEIIKKNPYKLLDDGIGVNFNAIDKMAMNLGFNYHDENRTAAGIKYALGQASVSGHTCLVEEMLKDYVSDILEVDVESIEGSLITLSIEKKIVVEKRDDKKYIYLMPFHIAETNVSHKVIEMTQDTFKEHHLDSQIDNIQEQTNLILSEQQKVAVKEVLQNRITIITGGPGTGKTTIIKTIIRLLANKGLSVVLSAPTGRAAKRMTEATGVEAKTLHRLLGINIADDGERTALVDETVEPITEDVVIVDEASMLDILLTNHLIKAIDDHTRLVLVGDVDQLPSVGPGNILKDIIDSGIVKVIRLHEVFRQAAQSMIVVNAHKINNGQMPVVNVKDNDFFYIKEYDQNKILQTIISLCTERLQKFKDLDILRDVQILSPCKKGILGVKNMNKELQKVLNPFKHGIIQKDFGENTYRVGDKVMQIRNNYNITWKKSLLTNNYGTHSFWEKGEGVYNGDLGRIIHIDLEEEYIRVLFDDDKVVDYEFSQLEELELAYATTVHKSQGSEFVGVIIPLFPTSPKLLTRNLIYTAVTRAKELLILVGRDDVLANMISNLHETNRYSGLKYKINKNILK